MVGKDTVALKNAARRKYIGNNPQFKLDRIFLRGKKNIYTHAANIFGKIVSFKLILRTVWSCSMWSGKEKRFWPDFA